MSTGKPITKKLTKMATGKPITNFFRVNQLGLTYKSIKFVMADYKHYNKSSF